MVTGMTHFLHIYNDLSLYLRYNVEEDIIEYVYSNSTEVRKSNIKDNGTLGEPYFTTYEGLRYFLECFNPIKKKQ